MTVVFLSDVELEWRSHFQFNLHWRCEKKRALDLLPRISSWKSEPLTFSENELPYDVRGDARRTIRFGQGTTKLLAWRQQPGAELKSLCGKRPSGKQALSVENILFVKEEKNCVGFQYFWFCLSIPQMLNGQYYAIPTLSLICSFYLI